MNEWQILGIGLFKILLALIIGGLYAVGGRTCKWIRRFVAPFILCSGIYALSFSYDNISLCVSLCITYGLLALGYCQGYGGDTSGEKFLRRLKCGLMITGASLPLAIFTGSWLLFGMQMAIGTLTMIVLGIFNPIEAAEEELLIGTITCILVPFYL